MVATTPFTAQPITFELFDVTGDYGAEDDIITSKTLELDAIPEGWPPTPGLENNMQIVARLQYATGDFSENPNDMVAGFIGDESRGVASPDPEEDNLIFLTIGADEHEEGDLITFEAYLYEESEVVTLHQTLTFEELAQIGTPADPFIFTEVRPTYAFSYPDLTEPLTEGEDAEIPVTFETIEEGVMGYEEVRFSVEAEGPGDVTFTATDSEGTEFTFTNSGYWGPEDGFDLPLDYEETTDWTLNFSEVGAYTITFNAFEIPDEANPFASDAATVSVAPDWSPEPGLENNMQIVARLQYKDREFSENPFDMVAGFIGGEPRGVASPDPEEDNLIFLTIGADEHEEGETITFKAYLNDQDEVVELHQTLVFEDLLQVGTPADPFIFTEVRPIYAFSYPEIPDPILEEEDALIPVTFKTIEEGVMGYEDVRFYFEADGPGDVTFTATDSEGTEFTFTNNGYWGTRRRIRPSA